MLPPLNPNSYNTLGRSARKSPNALEPKPSIPRYARSVRARRSSVRPTRSCSSSCPSRNGEKRLCQQNIFSYFILSLFLISWCSFTCPAVWYRHVFLACLLFAQECAVYWNSYAVFEAPTSRFLYYIHVIYHVVCIIWRQAHLSCGGKTF